MDDLTQILDIAQSLGTAGIFIFLYIREMNKHDLTRQEYRQDLRDWSRLQSLRPMQDDDKN